MRDQRYEDMLYLPHPTSKKHPRMSPEDRAAQFSPFSALTGYEETIQETARRTEKRMELDEYSRELLDRQMEKIRFMLNHPERQDQKGKNMGLPRITVTWFVPDERKEGGSYVTETGTLWKILEYEQKLILENGREIPVREIVELTLEEQEKTSF